MTDLRNRELVNENLKALLSDWRLLEIIIANGETGFMSERLLRVQLELENEIQDYKDEIEYWENEVVKHKAEAYDIQNDLRTAIDNNLPIDDIINSKTYVEGNLSHLARLGWD